MAAPKKTLTVRKLADRTEGERHTRLRIPADRVTVDPASGDLVLDPSEAQTILWNPDTPGFDHEPWPFAGISIEGGVPKTCRVSTTFVKRGRQEGWITLENERVAHEPGGPDGDEWKTTHTFTHGDALVLHTVDGDIRYLVAHQPGKYDDPSEPSGKRVDWFFDLKLEG